MSLRDHREDILAAFTLALDHAISAAEDMPITLRRSTDNLSPFWEARYEPEDVRSAWNALRRYDSNPENPYRPEEEGFCGRILPAGWCPYHPEALQPEELPLWNALLDPNKQAAPTPTEYEKRVAEARAALQAINWAHEEDDTVLLAHALLG